MTASASVAPGAAGRGRELGAWGASLALHAALLAAVLTLRPAHRPAPAAEVQVEIVEQPAPVAPPPARREPEPAPRPARVAKAPPPAATAVPRSPAPPSPAPPPPSAAPPADARPGPIRFGVSMSSTTPAGVDPAPVGNTLYGKVPERAGDPAEAKPYRADRYAPPTQVSTLPQPIRVAVPRSEYPPDAARQGIEGLVRLRLVVDEEGNVRDAALVSDPGHGLGAAAVRAAKRYFKFRPAMKDGVTVATEIPFTVAFELD